MNPRVVAAADKELVAELVIFVAVVLVAVAAAPAAVAGSVIGLQEALCVLQLKLFQCFCQLVLLLHKLPVVVHNEDHGDSCEENPELI